MMRIFILAHYVFSNPWYWPNDSIIKNINIRNKRSYNYHSRKFVPPDILKSHYDTHQKVSDIELIWWPWVNTDNRTKRVPFEEEIVDKILSEKCGSCFITNNLLYQNQARAILFDTTYLFQYLHGSNRSVPMPATRPYDQYWVGRWRESSGKGANKIYNLRNNTGHFNGFDKSFNLTGGYRRDADIYYNPLGTPHRLYLATQREIKLGITNDKILEHKVSKSVAISMVSNCGNTKEAKNRIAVIKKLLERGLKITGIGGCFKNLEKRYENLNYISDRGDKTPSKFDRKILREHKFYLAFENALHCRDYVSEKVWRNSYGNLAVPVVLGPWRDDIFKQAPKKSFIFVEDFKSPDDLIDYLNYLDRNDTAYMEYFEWRNHVDHELNGEGPEYDYLHKYTSYADSLADQMCKICTLMRNYQGRNWPKKTITSYSHYVWMDQPDKNCTGTDLKLEQYFDANTMYLPARSDLYTYANKP